MTNRIKVGIVSLGCDKNRVDSENMIGFLSQEFDVVNSYDEADVVIINTCSFIESAVNESIDAIMEAHAATKAKLIVTGCLPQRYPEIAANRLLPEVSAFLDNQHYAKIVETVYTVLEGGYVVHVNEGKKLIPCSPDRVLTTPMHYAYLKIAEGCSNACAYCAIPAIRGGYIATPVEDLVAEAKRLEDNYGVRELILVAQDVTRYRDGERGLLQLLDALEQGTTIEKFRLMYCYPELVTKALIDRVNKDERIAKYLDIPMQHAADGVLRAMRRRSNYDSLCQMMDYIRKHTDIAVRSTFMVGFPGETDEDVEILISFLRRYRLEYAGFFPFYREEGTPAYAFARQVPQRTKKKRLQLVEEVQSSIMENIAKSYIGRDVEVMCDGIDYDRACFVGHTDRQHPEIDNKVYFGATFVVNEGQSYRIHITGVDKLDLVGEAYEE